MQMMRDGLKLWSNGSDAHNSDPEEDEDEEEMLFGENDDESEDMMDLSDLPTSLFACSVHDAVFEEDRQRDRLCLDQKETLRRLSQIQHSFHVNQVWAKMTDLRLPISGGLVLRLRDL
ncbi:calcipressin-3 isoform X1 [Ictalurus punctatus]|uniref:Calcipressin-3 isoform X1 n=1 Tax=Ictalurus punctatus TaxID=7998 RepID=A0A9F7RNN1_ICTPU|nr:calcipressin-3 isoform X1 [Ictalurus punctatus]